MIKLLAIDASQPMGSVAVWTPEEETEQLLTDDNASAILQTLGADPSYTHICLGHGPGRMTGLRSTASFVASLAMVHNTEVRVVSSLLIMATSAYLLHGHEKWQVVIDARLGQYYVAEYCFHKTKIEVITQPCLINNLVLSPHTCGVASPKLAVPLEVVFDFIPWLPALSLFELWQHSGLTQTVSSEKIPLIYLRNPC